MSVSVNFGKRDKAVQKKWSVLLNMSGLAVADRLERRCPFFQRTLHRQSLDGGAELHTVTIGVIQQVLRVLGIGEGRAVGQQNHVRLETPCQREMFLRAASG